MMRQAKALRAEMEEIQAELAETEASGSSGGGKVTATVKGSGAVTGLVIDPSVVNPEDTSELSDLILVAIEAANDAMAVITEQKMGPYAAMMNF
jgi:DNA-binding YbaB/EbfC family protein